MGNKPTRKGVGVPWVHVEEMVAPCQVCGEQKELVHAAWNQSIPREIDKALTDEDPGSDQKER